MGWFAWLSLGEWGLSAGVCFGLLARIFVAFACRFFEIPLVTVGWDLCEIGNLLAIMAHIRRDATVLPSYERYVWENSTTVRNWLQGNNTFQRKVHSTFVLAAHTTSTAYSTPMSTSSSPTTAGAAGASASPF